MKHAPPLFAACLALATSACDSLATGQYRPEYFTITATLDDAVSLPPGQLRVALVWDNIESPGANYADQLVDVSTQLTSFEIKVSELPRPSVLHTLPPDEAAQLGVDPKMQWADGTIVVYVDDGNGRLDVTPTLGASTDTIIAAATNVDLFYLAAGQPAPGDFITIFPTAPGLSLVHDPPRAQPDFGACDSFDANGHYQRLCEPTSPTPPTLFAAGETLHLTVPPVADRAPLQGYTCDSFWGPFAYPDWYNASASDICDGGACRFCRGYQCPLDLPKDPVTPIECSPDRLAYRFTECAPDDTLCGTEFCHYGHGERLAGDPAPAGWPCP